MTLPVLLALFRRSQEAVQEPDRLVSGALGTLVLVSRHEHPGQGDVLELAQVTEVVIDGQALLTRPAESFTEAALRDPVPVALNAGTGRTLGKKSPTYSALRLVEQVECAVQIPFSLAYPSHRDPPAIPVLRQPGVLAQLLAPQQLLRGGMQVVALAVDLAHPDVHVCRSPQNRPALLGCTLQCLLVGAHRLAEATLREPDVRQRDRAAEGIGNVPGPPQSRHAFGVRRMPCLEVPARPGREPQQARCPGPAEVVVLRRKFECPPGVPNGAGQHRPEPGPARHGTARSSPGGGGIPPRRPRPFLPNGPPISHRYRLSRPASARRPAVGSQLPRARRPTAVPRQTRR